MPGDMEVLPDLADGMTPRVALLLLIFRLFVLACQIQRFCKGRTYWVWRTTRKTLDFNRAIKISVGRRPAAVGRKTFGTYSYVVL